MIKAHYTIELKDHEFEALKQIIRDRYIQLEECSVSESNIFRMFGADREDLIEDSEQ